MSGIYSLKEVRFLFEHEGEIKREAEIGLIDISTHLDMEISLRDLYHIFEYIFLTREMKYIETILIPLVHRIYNSQLKKKTIYKVSYGRYSPVTEYREIHVDDEYLKTNAGAFPTVIGRDHLYIYGLYPDLDSTAYAVLILSKSYRLLKDKLKGDFIKSIEEGVDYLLLRDVNNDGLVEQLGNEDWAVGACREGSITYTNLITFLALEEAYDLFLSIGNQEYIEKIEKRLSRASDAILNKLWIKDYFVNGLDRYGKYDLTYSLDTVYITQSVILQGEDKVKTHMKTLASKLTVEGLLTSFYPVPYGTCVEDLEPYTSINGGVWPRFNILFARALIKMGYITEAAKLLRNLIDVRKYKWVNPKNKLQYEEDEYRENNMLFLITLKELRETLEKLEEGPASTGQG